MNYRFSEASCDEELLYLYRQAAMYRQGKEETPFGSLLSRSGHANMTVCPRCHVDDFTHVEGCEFIPVETTQDNSITSTYLMKEPVIGYTIKGARPELKGLEVGFDADGYVCLRCVADSSLAFILTREASLKLSDLIREHHKPEYFGLAT